MAAQIPGGMRDNIAFIKKLLERLGVDIPDEGKLIRSVYQARVALGLPVTCDNSSGMHCPGCRETGVSHCSDPVNCGGMQPMQHTDECAHLRPVTLDERLTGEMFMHRMIAANIGWVSHHACGVCGSWVGYFRTGSDLFFDPSCGCCMGIPRRVPWSDAVKWLELQTSLDEKRRILTAFGFKIAD